MKITKDITLEDLSEELQQEIVAEVRERITEELPRDEDKTEEEYETITDDISFICEEFFGTPISVGALKGELNPSLAVEKMIEVAKYLKEVRDNAK
jgi:CRISPR/Cas system-associated protein Cas7 (RAMP superfamily)